MRPGRPAKEGDQLATLLGVPNGVWPKTNIREPSRRMHQSEGHEIIRSPIELVPVNVRTLSILPGAI